MKKLLFTVLWFIGILLAVSDVQSQTIPDSVLQRIPMPELGPNDTIPVPAQLYQNSEILPSQTLELAWVTAKYPSTYLKRKKSGQD